MRYFPLIFYILFRSGFANPVPDILGDILDLVPRDFGDLNDPDDVLPDFSSGNE